MILSRSTPSYNPTLVRRCLGVLALLTLTLHVSVGRAQQTPEMVFEPAPGASSSDASASASGFPQSHIFGDAQPEDAGVGGFGVLGRVGHIAGETIERNQSITYFDLSPYLFAENTYLFGDGRLFLTNQGKMGFSTGLGVRQYFPRNDFVVGASAWYDQDDSRKATFRQMGIGLELFSQWMDIRSNYYTSIGENSRELGTTITPGSAAFSGNNIVFSTQTALSVGADMVDINFTVPVPGEIPQSINLEASAGWYKVFTPGIELEDVDGFKLRLDGDFLDRVLHLYTELTHDEFFDTNLVIAADVNYWHHLESRPRFGASQFNRIAQWVRRNRNVVTIDSTRQNAPQVAINPNTNNPYFLYHVRNVETPPPNNFPAPAGTGSIDTPFQFIDEAQAAIPNADLIFVHADSVFDNRPLVINDGELILGEGVSQSIPVQGLPQELDLPRATGGANRPIFRNTVGTAVTLADGSTFAGFDINDTQGTAIFGSGIIGSRVRDVRITNTTGLNAHGVHLQGVGGTVVMQDVSIVNTAGNAFFVDGGNSTTTFTDGVITNSSGYAILIENNAGSVNMVGTTTTDTGGQGVRIAGSTGATTLGSLTLSNTASVTGNAIEIENVAGTVSIFEQALITDAAGDGIFVNNLSGSFSALENVTINQRNGVGINLQNITSTGVVNFGKDVTMGTPDSGGVGDHGINYQNSEGLASFNIININGSQGAGINIGDRLGVDVNTGRFIVADTTTISNTIGSAVQLLNDESDVQFSGIGISERNDHGIEILNHSNRARFSGISVIANDNNDGDAALDIQQNTGTIAFDAFIASNTRGPDPGAVILDNTGSVSFLGLSVESIQTTAVDIERNTNISIQGGSLDAEGARAVTMIDNESFSVVFDSVSSSDSDYGIFVTNNTTDFDRPGTFQVVGDSSTAGSGGTISNASIAGAFLSNVNRVGLNFMQYQDNQVGVLVDNINDFAMIGNEVSSSLSFGLDVLNADDVLLQQNLFDSNLGFNQIRIQASRLLNPVSTPNTPNYSITIRDNIIQDNPDDALVGLGDMVFIGTLAGANNSSLDLSVVDNGRTIAGGIVGFSSNRLAGDAALGTTWNGDVRANYVGNNIRLSDNAGQIGFELQTTRSAAVNNINYEANVLNDGGGSNDTGLRFDLAGSSVVSIVNNFGLDANGNPVVDGFAMEGRNNVNDTAIDLIFRNINNSIDISRNRVTFNSRGGTAVLFETISGPSSVNMDGNRLIMFDDGFLPEARGIVFQTVVGTIGLSSFNNQDNVILPNGTFGTIPFSIPNGVSTGSLLINGQRLP